MKHLLVILTTIFVFLSASAQDHIDRDKILDKRLDKIFFYHFGTGLEIAVHQNYMLSPKVYLGVGSNRNLFNADVGFKISFYNPVNPSDSEYIRYYTMPVFLSGSINAIRWKQNAIFVGGEIAYNFALGAGHHSSVLQTEDDSHSIAKSHISWQGKLGYRHKSWDFSAFYEHDSSPAINQKYVYESIDYNYDNLYDSIFERWRWGMSVTYNFRF